LRRCRRWRRRSEKIWGKTAIGVTGSMGKTTTKEAMAHLLADQVPRASHQGKLQ